METNNILATDLSQGSFQNIQATLCTLDAKTSLDKALLSYWTVTYLADEVEIVLTIHALSGQVWKADICAGEGKMPAVSYSEEELLAVMFPLFVDKKAQIQADDGNSYVIVECSYVQAVVKRYALVTDTSQLEEHLHMKLCAAVF